MRKLQLEECPLCKNKSVLTRSHIIPKFTQKEIKKFDGTMRRFTEKSHADGDIIQDEFYEHLLCSNCEGRFQKWEDYVARLIYQKRVFDFTPTKPGELVQLKALNYSKLKLFLLSLIWRMGVSRLPMFSEVKLGPHEERLRRMLVEDTPGGPADYGSTLVVVHVDGQRVNLTRPADSIHHRTHRLYRALIDGLLVTWVIGQRDHMSRFELPQMFLQADGSWLTHTKDLHTIAFVSHETKKLMTRESR